jgi:hypothetical protein
MRRTMVVNYRFIETTKSIADRVIVVVAREEDKGSDVATTLTDSDDPIIVRQGWDWLRNRRTMKLGTT